MRKAWRLATAFVVTLGMAWGIDNGYDAYQDWEAEGGQGLVAQSENVSSAEADRAERQEERDAYIAQYEQAIASMDMIEADLSYWVQDFVTTYYYEGNTTEAAVEIRGVYERTVALAEEIQSFDPPTEYKDEQELLSMTVSNAQLDISVIYDEAVISWTTYDWNSLAMWAYHDTVVESFSSIERDLRSTDNDYNAL